MKLVSLTALLMSLICALPAHAQMQVQAGITTEVCYPPATTNGSYSAGRNVGGLISLPNAVGGVNNSGVLQSVRLNFKDAQTGEFDVIVFDSKPATSFSDNTVYTLTAADNFLAQPPLKLISYYSTYVGSGAGTTYGTDGIGRAIMSNSSTLYAIVLNITGSSLGSTQDMQLCVTTLRDN